MSGGIGKGSVMVAEKAVSWLVGAGLEWGGVSRRSFPWYLRVV